MTLPGPLIPGTVRPKVAHEGIGVDALALHPQTSLPVSPEEGQIVRLTDGRVMHYKLGSWVELGSGSGGSANSADQVSYTNSGYPSLANVQQALDQLLYVVPSVTGFSNSVGTVEIGSTVSSLTLTWSYNKLITTQSIDQGIGSLSAGLRTLLLSGQTITGDRTYTLAASDGVNPAGAATSVLFRNKRFWGLSGLASLTGPQLNSLSGNELSADFNQTRTFAALGQYLYFAWPSSFGDPTFTVNGLTSTAWIKTVVSYTNGHGYVSNFNVYRSQFLQNGSGIVVQVSP